MAWTLPDPANRLALTSNTFFTHLLPPILVNGAITFLVLLPRTQYFRLLLVPIQFLCVYRAVTGVSIAYAFEDSANAQAIDFAMTLSMITIAMRSLQWAVTTGTVYRIAIPGKTMVRPDPATPAIKIVVAQLQSRSIEGSLPPFNDFLDLCFNFRGLGWSWGDRFLTHRRTRPVSVFVWSAIQSILLHGMLLDAFGYYLLTQGNGTYVKPVGGTIFAHPSRPFWFQFIASRLLCIPFGLAGYATINLSYQIMALVSVLVLGHRPEQWPPLFDAPWRSTSLAEFWGTRWHQINRITYLKLGGQPLGYVFKRQGKIMGSFFISAILHDWGTYGLGHGTDFWRAGGFFLLMGLGVVLEGFWLKMTGSRVNGMLGWIWTACWIVGWSGLIVESWAANGLMGTVMPKEIYVTHHILLFLGFRM